MKPEPQKKGEWSATQTLGFLIFALMLIVGLPMLLMFSFTSQKPHADESHDSPVPLRSVKLSEREANASVFRDSMMEKERALRAKYAKQNPSNTDEDRDASRAHRHWRDLREQQEEFLSGFEPDDSEKPDSIQAQMKKSLELMEEDRPERF